MRGGLVACFGDGRGRDEGLARMAAHLRWHRGRSLELGSGPLSAVLLVDDGHGPFAERGAGRLVISHGRAPGPIADLVRGAGRVAALEWDGAVLRAVRDPIGEVPLFHRRLGRAIWFSTEIPSLVALGGAIPDLDALAAMATGHPYPDRTGWRDVLRVLPGEILEIAPSLETSRWRYWDPARLAGRRGPGPAEAAEELRARLERAVERSLGERTGVLVSGGLDSSSVAVLAAHRRRDAGRTVLVGVGYPSVPAVDESVYAHAVGTAAGLPLHWLHGRLDRWDARTESDPYGVPSRSLPTGVFDTALPALTDAGCDVLLDGHDGDGVLGHPHAPHANALLDGAWHSLAVRAEGGGRTTMLRTLASEFLPPALRMRRLRGRSTVREDIARDLPYFHGPVRDRFLAEFGWRPPRSGWRYQQVRVLLPPFTQHFEELESQAACHGIDIRHPFADRDLVEFLVSLPHSVKASPLRSKPLLRDALADVLPALVRDRRDKSEFSPVIDRRVDYGACLAAIEESGVHLPGVDYGRLHRETDPSRERCAWIRLARAHVFAARSAA